MADAVQSKSQAGTKSRLSLLSSRQSGIRLKSSEELPDKPALDLAPVVRAGDPECDPNDAKLNPVTESSIERLILREAESTSTKNETEFVNVIETNQTRQEQRFSKNGQQSTQDGEFSKLHHQLMNFGKQSGYAIEDLFRIMTLLKSEIQTKEIALNSFKTEQLKRLINPIEVKKSALANAYKELQDRMHMKESADRSNRSKIKQRASSASGESKETENPDNQRKCGNADSETKKRLSVDQTGSDGAYKVSNESPIHQDEDETLNMMVALLELLDRHPLLALPRDAMYCLDYACNDVSTKNYLNLKIQGLENLIEQHRRFRYHICERLKRSEQRYMDLNLKLELERNIQAENERNIYKASGKTVLLSHIKQLKEALEDEKASKQALVMTLLNELLDEREKNAVLEEKVIELEKKLAENKSGTKPASQPVAPVSSKPRVPAKPAQLLDRQRSQTKMN